MNENAGSDKRSDCADEGGGLRVALADGRRGLEEVREQWAALATSAIEPNVFLEPFAVLPALDNFGKDKDLAFVCVFRPDPNRPAQEQMVGFVPFERRRSFRWWPVSILCVWNHSYLLLSTPLIHKEVTREVWAAIFEWARKSPLGAALIEFPYLRSEGHAYHVLVDVLRDGALLSNTVDHYTRPLLLVPDRATVRNLLDNLSGGARREVRRRLRRLSEVGKVEFQVLQPGGDIERWVNDFLEMEARGWKSGSGGNAMLLHEEDADYFRGLCRGAHAAGRLHMLALFLDGRPIAMKCNFLCNNGSFNLKIAYDEEFSKYSPGFLLEVENVESLKRLQGIEWMDSCSAQKTFFDDFWADRRGVEHVLIETGNRWGKLCLGIFPLLRSLKRIMGLSSVTSL